MNKDKDKKKRDSRGSSDILPYPIQFWGGNDSGTIRYSYFNSDSGPSSDCPSVAGSDAAAPGS